MDVWPVGLSTGCFYRKSIFEVLEPIARSGFSILEICSYPAHLDYRDQQQVSAAARALAAHGLEPFSFHAPFGGTLDISAPDRRLRRDSVEEMCAAARAAAALGAKHFVIHPGPEIEGKPLPEEHRERLRNASRSLARIARICAGEGMRLLLENMLPHLLLGSAADLRWLMEKLAPCRPGLCLDTGHAFLAGDPAGIVPLFPGCLVMAHAADNRGAADDHLPPGEGNIDWRRLLGLLRASAFRGVLVLELAGDARTPPDLVLAAALRARQLLREIALETLRHD